MNALLTTFDAMHKAQIVMVTAFKNTARMQLLDAIMRVQNESAQSLSYFMENAQRVLSPVDFDQAAALNDFEGVCRSQALPLIDIHSIECSFNDIALHSLFPPSYMRAYNPDAQVFPSIPVALCGFRMTVSLKANSPDDVHPLLHTILIAVPTLDVAKQHGGSRWPLDNVDIASEAMYDNFLKAFFLYVIRQFYITLKGQP